MAVWKKHIVLMCVCMPVLFVCVCVRKCVCFHLTLSLTVIKLYRFIMAGGNHAI